MIVTPNRFAFITTTNCQEGSQQKQAKTRESCSGVKAEAQFPSWEARGMKPVGIVASTFTS